nr:M13-type metalloendopeptidase [Paenibacillus sp. SYP-B3998]
MIPSLALAAETQTYATREQVVHMLLNAADAYYPRVKKAHILKGFDKGERKDSQSVTRAEAFVMVSRAFPVLPEPEGNDLRKGTFQVAFTDVPPWAEKEIAKLADAGLLAGYSDDRLGASDPITLEQLQTVIHRIWALVGSNPKDDFYEAINKKWLKDSKIQDGETSNGGFIELAHANEDKLKGILADLIKKKHTQGTDEQKIADFYKAALDTVDRNKQGIEPVSAYLKAFDEAKSVGELIQANIRLEKETSMNEIMSFDVLADAKNSSMNALYYSGPTIRLPKKSYVTGDEKAKMVYTQYLAKLLVLSGENEKAAIEQAQQIYQMEKELAIVKLDPQDEGNVSNYYNPYSMEQFFSLYPGIDVKQMMTSMHITEANKVIVTDVKLAEKTAEFLTEGHLELIKSYAKVHLLMGIGTYLSDEFRQANNQFSAELYGVAGVRTNEEIALRTTKNVMSDLLSQHYVKKYFSAEAKENVQQMAHQFIVAYKERIQALDWMSEATKEKAILKLSKMTVKIGYPDKWPTIFKKVEIKTYAEGGSLFDNIARVSVAVENEKKAQLGKPVDKSEWAMSAYEVNAYYNSVYNEIVFPAGILQAPFYEIKAKPEANLGAIGMVIAHEISHAFDNNGAAFDENGNANDWWTEADYKKFEEKCQRVIQFYNGIEIINSVTNNGQLTVSENVADLGGMATSLQVASTLKHPDFKAYFESSAKIWRFTTTKELAAYRSMTDVHSANKVRVNRTFVNFPEFYKAYDIGPGDGMYVAPADRVSIW